MKRELQEKIYKDFPKLFAIRDQSLRESLMCFGIDAADGWYNLIRKMCKELQATENDNLIFTQIKEKLGGLRVYTANATEKEYEILRKYEKESYYTCEICGTSGKLTNYGWLRTLCKTCSVEYSFRYHRLRINFRDSLREQLKSEGFCEQCYNSTKNVCTCKKDDRRTERLTAIHNIIVKETKEILNNFSTQYIVPLNGSICTQCENPWFDGICECNSDNNYVKIWREFAPLYFTNSNDK